MPTQAGAALLSRARSLLADAAALRDAVDDHKGLRSGHLRVGVGPYPLDLSVGETVARIAARHPLLQIELIEGGWRDFGPKLLAGEVEVAVMESSIVAADPRYQVEALPTHQGCLYCRQGHPLAGRRGLTLAQILAYPLVGVRIPATKLTAASAGAHGLLPDPVTGDLMPRVTTTSFAASRAIIRRTDGIGMAVSVQIADDVRRGELAILDFAATTLKTEYGITYLRGRSLPPAVREFIDTLKEVEAGLREPALGAIKKNTSHATSSVSSMPPKMAPKMVTMTRPSAACCAAMSPAAIPRASFRSRKAIQITPASTARKARKTRKSLAPRLIRLRDRAADGRRRRGCGGAAARRRA